VELCKKLPYLGKNPLEHAPFDQGRARLAVMDDPPAQPL
jgi:hypothetical protein